MTARILPYVVPFLGALALTLVLTPIVRGINRRLGMVDRPGGRRINRTPVPRGGGVALFLGIAVSYSLFLLISGHQPLGPVPTYVFLRLSALAALLLTAFVQVLVTALGSGGALSAIGTAILQTLWSLPVSVLCYFPPAKWIE